MNPLYDLLTWTYVETLFSLWNDLNSQYNYSSGSCKNHLLPPDSIRIFVVKEAGVFCVLLSVLPQCVHADAELWKRRASGRDRKQLRPQRTWWIWISTFRASCNVCNSIMDPVSLPADRSACAHRKVRRWCFRATLTTPVCVWALTWTLSPVGKPSNWSMKVVLQRKQTHGWYSAANLTNRRRASSNIKHFIHISINEPQRNSTHHLAVGPDSTPLCCPVTHSKRTRYRPSVFRL